jgi:hypothetical protein
MIAAFAGNEVLAVVGGGFVALWRGQPVRAPDGRAHHFATERDARDFCVSAMLLMAYRPSQRGAPSPKGA